MQTENCKETLILTQNWLCSLHLEVPEKLVEILNFFRDVSSAVKLECEIGNTFIIIGSFEIPQICKSLACLVLSVLIL